MAEKNRPQNWGIKQGSRLDPSCLEIETFIGVYSIFIGTSYLLVCPVICSCCWESSRSGGAEPCFSVVLSPIRLSTWKIQGNIIRLNPFSWCLSEYCAAHMNVLLHNIRYATWSWKIAAEYSTALKHQCNWQWMCKCAYWQLEKFLARQPEFQGRKEWGNRLFGTLNIYILSFDNVSECWTWNKPYLSSC